MPAEKIPSWLKQVLMPELNEIKGELKAVNTRIDALESNLNIRIDSLRNETKTEINSVRNEIAGVGKEIESLRTEMNVKFDSLEKRIPVIEKITALELKIADIEKRLALA